MTFIHQKLTRLYFKLKPLFSNKKILIIGVLILTLVFVLLPHFSQAQVAPREAPKEAKLGPIGGALAWILYFFKVFMYWLTLFAARIFAWVMRGTQGFLNSELVTIGWSVVRDTANMFFILILLFIAFATILRIEQYTYRKMLTPMIIAILLVNFSRTICNIIVEFCDTLMMGFIGGISGGKIETLPDAIIHGMHLDQMWEVAPNWWETWTGSGSMILTQAFDSVYACVAFGAMMGICIFLIVRVLALSFLTIVSPLIFAFQVIPAAKTFTSKWWPAFIKYALYGPIAAFCIALAGKMSELLRDDKIGVLGFDELAGPEKAKLEVAAFSSAISTPRAIVEGLFVCGILFASIKAAQALGMAGAGAITKFASGAAGFVPKQLGQFAGAQLALGKKSAMGRFLTTGKGAAVGKFAGKIAEPVRKKVITPMMGVVNKVREAMGKPTAEKAKERIEANKDLTADQTEKNLSRGIREKGLRGNILGDMVSMEQQDPGRLRRSMATNHAFTDLLSDKEKEKFSKDIEQGVAGDEMYTTLMDKQFKGEAPSVMDKLGQVSRKTKDFSLYGMTKFNDETGKIGTLSKEARNTELIDKIGRLSNKNMPHVSDQVFLDIDLVKRIRDENPDLGKKILEHANPIAQKRYSATLEHVPIVTPSPKEKPLAVEYKPEKPEEEPKSSSK